MRMEIRILLLMTAITVCVLPKANTLMCLQCNNVPQPRHCNAVTECDQDETCGIEEVSNEFGEKLFNVGCMKKVKCLGANSTQHCIQCCSTDVCNHEGCGEIGYPRNRGPVCYNCPVHTDSKACHFVDICRAGEVCKFDSRREFGDMLFSSGCSDAHACKQGAPLQPSLVGRDISDNKYFGIKKQHRSLIEHVCRSCCESDLCNNMCNGSISAATSQCVSNPCHHGQCYDVSNGFVCVCNHGYEGRQCDKLKLPCASNPCMHGNCTNENDGYTCQCPQDYRGTHCEFKILPCELNPCMHGNCTNENDGYTCQCPQEYTGTNCETKILPCESNPCMRGNCTNENDGYTCQCPQDYTGTNCETKIFPCELNPCMRGNCTNENNGYTCQCPQDYKGRNCESKILPCELNPCMRGNCTNVINGYTCQCLQDYTGKNCETKILPCESNPCIRGNCTNENDGYTCQCPQDYRGRNCEYRLLSDCYDLLNIDHVNVFQKRFNGSVDFYKSFHEYENGFGSLDGEFWLGLAYIQEMASQGQSELRLDLKAANGSTAYETYQDFSIGVSPTYTLHINPGIGTAGDSAGLYFNNGHNFATYDHDNSNSCAKTDHGGWWYYICTFANLNGEYITPGTMSSYNGGEGGMIYRDFQGDASLKETKMMFRRV